MISDEMRELVSTYVDGELRESDAARVEELAERDPELRREIDDYRKLSRKLKDWDEAEHGVEPAPTLEQRALARARTLNADRKAEARGRLVALAFHPASVAAALLLAVGLGAMFAKDAPAPASVTATAPRDVAIAPLGQPLDLAEAESALQPYTAPEAERRPGILDVVRFEGRLYNGFVMSETAIRLYEELRDEEALWERRKQEILVRDGGSRTRSWNMHVHALVSGYKAVAQPVTSMVLVRDRAEPDGLPELRPTPAGERALDQPGANEDLLSFWPSEKGAPVLSPLGEVWVARKDRTRRTRVVSTSNVLAGRGATVAVAWADDAQPRVNRSHLELQPFVLGPEARRRIAGRVGWDAALGKWLEETYGDDLAKAYEKGLRKRARDVRRLVTELDREPDTVGFAVVDAKTGRTLGVELFATQELMLAFAPRLLHGYLLEAGEAIELRKPTDAAPKVQKVLDEVAERATKREPVADMGTEIPKELGLERVRLLDATGNVVGHGIVHGNRPVHLTIFAD